MRLLQRPLSHGLLPPALMARSKSIDLMREADCNVIVIAPAAHISGTNSTLLLLARKVSTGQGMGYGLWPIEC